MKSRRLSRPVFSVLDVTKCWGNSSHVFVRASIHAFALSRAREVLNLSALVNTTTKGTPFSPSQSRNWRSIFCCSWRMSINRKRHTRLSRSKTYRLIICSRSLCTVLERLANPYPGKSTRYHSLFTKKWFINKVLPGV